MESTIRETFQQTHNASPWVTRLALLIILLFGFTARVWDINWDSNFHLHPDERFLTMVANDSHLPSSVGEYLDPTRSPLVPYNIGHRYFTYGAFPVALTKATAVIFGLDNYDDLALVGRFLAALFDTATILCVFLLAQSLFAIPLVSLGAALVYAAAVLAIQHSHFFVVDAFGTAFFAFALLALVRYRFPLASGLLFGASIGCKVSFLFQAPVLGVALLVGAKSWGQRCGWVITMTLSTYLGLRFADPKFFESASLFNPWINPQFVANLMELKRLSDYAPHPWPPGVQWLSKTPILFTVQNFVLYGFGIIPTLCAMWGTKTFLAHRSVQLMAGWIVLFLLYSGAQFLQTMRYVYALYPLAAILAGIGLAALWHQAPGRTRVLSIILVLLWPLAFLQIYNGEHPRVSASRWLLEQVKTTAPVTIAHEHWDDSLPLRLPGYPFNIQFVELPVFEPDSAGKIAMIRDRLRTADFVVFSSNRGWGSLLPLKKQFPLTAAWYEEMFAEQGGFEIVYHERRQPHLFGIPYPTQFADEAFSVYDHPEVVIFKRRTN